MSTDREPTSSAGRPRPRDPWVALAALAAAEAWLALGALPALTAAGDHSGLPPAAWLLPVAAVVAPWVLTGRQRRTRGWRAGLGVLGCLAGAGVMVLSPLAGAVVALAWVGAVALLA